MKRIRIVQLIGIVLFLIYVALIITDLIFGYLGDYAIILLSVLLAVISLNQIYKGMILRSGSTLWFAITLILTAIMLIVFELLKINPIRYYFVFALIPIISSLINIAIFANMIYIKVIIINISIIIPILIMYFTNLNYWYIIAIGVISLILGVVFCRKLKLSKEKV